MDNLFEHIDDEEIKKVCISDFADLQKCMSNKAWKASMVLSGSLIETLLYSSLQNNTAFTDKVPNFEKRKVSLYDLLRWAKEYKIIDDGIFQFADQIRDYRNLIHPNVIIRGNKKINENICVIAYSVLLEILQRSKDQTDIIEQNALKKIINTKLSRNPTKSEVYVYLPILHKYGIEKGSKIIKRSLAIGLSHDTK